MNNNLSEESVASDILINLPSKMARNNIEIVEEAGDVRDAIELKFNFSTNPVDALKTHLEYARKDERKLNVKNLIEGLESDLNKDKALELASSYVDTYLKEEIDEMVEEAAEVTAISDECIEIIKNNFVYVEDKDKLNNIVSNLSDLSIPRKEYLVNILDKYISTMSSDTDLTKQISPKLFLSNVISVINNIDINLTNVLNAIDRYNNDIIAISVKDMIKQNIPSEDVKAMVSIEPYEPQEPNDTNVDLYQEALLIEEEDTTIDTYVGYYTLIETIINKLVLVESKLSNLDKIDTTTLTKVLTNLNKFIIEETNNELTEDKSKSLVYLLQYSVNNTTFVYNAITKAYSKINRDIKLLAEAINLCTSVSSDSINI